MLKGVDLEVVEYFKQVNTQTLEKRDGREKTKKRYFHAHFGYNSYNGYIDVITLWYGLIYYAILGTFDFFANIAFTHYFVSSHTEATQSDNGIPPVKLEFISLRTLCPIFSDIFSNAL